MGNSEASRRIVDTHSVKISVLEITKKFQKHHDIVCPYSTSRLKRSTYCMPMQENLPLKVNKIQRKIISGSW
jgi:hypothetical protein